MKVLHLSYDYPDDINENKTIAMKELIDISLEEYPESLYISLNRVNNPKNKILIVKKDGFQITTFGLPKGLFFRYFLYKSYKNVVNLNINFNDIDIIHAHKLTFEGPIAYRLFNDFGISYIVSLQQTDCKVLKFRKDLKNYYKKILLNAKKIIFISPWMIKEIKNIFGLNFFEKIKNKMINIPLVVEINKLYNNINNNGNLITTFHFKEKNIKIKNIERTIKALKDLKDNGEAINLHIVGEGPGKNIVLNIIEKYNMQEQISLIGSIDNKDIVNFMCNYKAFILCSYPETFGMVYIEALSAGLPIIHSERAGIDGFFDKDDIAIKVSYKSIEEIKKAICNIGDKKVNITRLHKSNKLQYFSREKIKRTYIDLLKNIEVINEKKI